MNKNKLSRLALIATVALPLTLGPAFAAAAGTQNQDTQNQGTQTQPQRVQPLQPGQRNQTQPGTQNQGQNAQPGQRGQDQDGRGQRGGDHGGQMGDRMGRGGGMRAVHAAVAKALGLTEEQLMTELRSGKTIAQIAQAKGVSTAAIRAAALNALKTDLAAAVKDGKLTQAQANDMLARAQADQNFGLQAGRGGRDGGKDGGPRGGKGGPRGQDQQAPAPATTRG